MAKVYVQFDGVDEIKVVSVFGSPQDPAFYPNQAELDDTDLRYLAFINPSSTLEGAKTAQIAALSTACQVAIYAGFTSSALGAAHSYPFQDKDQTNLAASVLESTLPGNAPDWTTPFWCADPSTTPATWAMLPHSAAQIQQVGRDAMAAKLAAIQRNVTLAGQVLAATTVAAVQAITWD